MYKKNVGSFLKHFDFFILDVICLLVAFLLSMLFRFDVISLSNQEFRDLWLKVMVIACSADVVVVAVTNPFQDVLKRGHFRELIRTIQHVVWVELVLIFILFILQLADPVSRAVIVMLPALYLFLSYVTRFFWKQCLKYRKLADRNLLVITHRTMAEEVTENIKTGEYQTIQVSGFIFLDQDQKGQQVNGIPVVANWEDMMDYICRSWVDEVMIVLPEGAASPKKLLQQLSVAGITRHLVIMTNDSRVQHNEAVDQIGKYTVITDFMNSVTWWQVLVKRLMDIAGGLVGCAITGIIYIFLAPAIKRKSPGPVFFAQERIGRNGRKFKIYKFRSMYMDAEDRKKELEEQNRVKDGMMFKLDFDPRIIGNEILPDGTYKTGLGDFIRRTSLDEFPQFYNVLKGDMSLVGTRPPTLDEWEKYDLHHRARMNTKPGITGMWQVSGRSNIVDFDEVVRLDTDYIRSWSIGLDIKILFKTVLSVLKKEGSM
ncbi:MAG: sugar transferase [Lachnospiraceae bacterium]|nr:sugar transferase [Lachnospiraceae bacterium]